MLKKILLFVIAVAIISAGIGYYLYNKPVEKTETKSADLVVTAEDLYKEYTMDETQADQKYLNKVVEVTGQIMGNLVGQNTFSGVQLRATAGDQGIICEFEMDSTKKNPRLPVGDVITLKCICTGKLMDVVLNRCVILNK